MIYCGAQAKGLKHPCCQSPNRVDDEESGKLRTCSTRTGHVRFLTRDSRRHFKTDVRKRQLNCFCFFLVLPGERRAASTEANMGGGGHSSWKHSAPKTNTQSRSGSSEFIWLLSGSLSNVPVRPFTFLTHSGGRGRRFTWSPPTRSVPFHSGRSFPANVTYASLISHYRLASPRLLRDLITIKLTIFKPIIGLQTLIKAMHWF